MPSRVVLWLACAAFAVWCIGFSGPYHFDDATTPLDDPASQSLTAFAHEAPRTLRPLTKITYALEASAGLDDAPAVRRAVTVAMLVVAAALLFALMRALVPALPPLAAGTLATIFVVHPIHAEGVLEICGRPAVLAMTLVLGALVAATHDRARAAAVLFGLAVLARETAFAALLPLAALELARPRAAHLRRLAPYAIAALVVAAWLAFTPRYRDLADFSLARRPVLDSIVAQVSAIPIGLSLYARPWALSLDHGEQLATSPADPGFVLGLALILLVAAVAVFAIRRRHAAVAVGAALWLAAILPTQSVIPKLDPLTERPLELGLAGLLLALAPFLARTSRWRFALAAALAIALAIATIARSRLYRSDLALWADAAEKSATNARPHYNYATLLRGLRRDGDAVRELEQAARLSPFDPTIDRDLRVLGHQMKREGQR